MYGRGAAYELNPHLAPDSGSDYACPYRECDGSGFVVDEETDSARPCRCRDGRIASARARRLDHAIPRRFQDLALDRNPVREILTNHPQAPDYRDFCLNVGARLDAGKGMWFKGDRGTGKTTLAMLISIEALRARRSVAIYTAPKLLETIRATYADDAAMSLTELVERLRTVDLLHIEDLAVPRTNEWVLEQLYTIVNDRYQDRRSVIFTADVERLSDLEERIGHRTASRLIDLCGEPILMHGEDYRLRPS
ncbi:MAG: ATP-binding protein [Actinomycetota bacterium]|nr:ATP-binding protein [Actinomycetota bacterium]